MKQSKVIKSNIIDIENRRIYPAAVTISGQRISKIVEIDQKLDSYLMPGFIDSHIHIESSMLVPSEFARLAVRHGTVATVSDPHEIANVLGIEGVKYMIENGRKVPFYFYFGAPPCVPATPFETSGASLGVNDVEELLKLSEVKYLSEMMNWPGVLNGDSDVLAKMEMAKKYGKPIDGHAPGLRGETAKRYVESGITTDHECFTIEEAIDKIRYGMKIQIREGSAARNFEVLFEMINNYYQQVMFCSDDKHPDDLVVGHINKMVSRAIKGGQDMFKVLEVACLNPIKHYDLEVGMLREGDFADFIEVDDLEKFSIKATWVRGRKVAENGQSYIKSKEVELVNEFNIKTISPSDIMISGESKEVRVIEVLDGELVTNSTVGMAKIENGNLVSNTDDDILKMVVVNRYNQSKPAIGFIRNFGLKRGAIASSVAHDSHNILAVGVSDTEILEAINLVIKQKGGLAVVDSNELLVLPLPVAGLMSDKPAEEVAVLYERLSKKVTEMGSTLRAPFMSLSFMALLVIPALKLSDKGLFDTSKFEFVDLKTA